MSIFDHLDVRKLNDLIIDTTRYTIDPLNYGSGCLFEFNIFVYKFIRKYYEQSKVK